MGFWSGWTGRGGMAAGVLLGAGVLLAGCEPAAGIWEAEESLEGPRFVLSDGERRIFEIDLVMGDVPTGGLPVSGTATVVLTMEGDDIDTQTPRSVEALLYNYHLVRTNELDGGRQSLSVGQVQEIELVGEFEVYCDALPCEHGLDLIAELDGPGSVGIDWTFDVALTRSTTEDIAGDLTVEIVEVDM